jgi:4-diphosphocytidyl-2-C-methyl-D-erythritol kinase
MKIKAPAKINIYLKVLNRRDDGFHELRTVMVPISLFDEIYLEPFDHGIVLKADGCNCETEDNLIHRAARLFFETTGVKTGVSIEMKKQIPVGAGLGGGSSDAASVLIALNDLFHAGLSTEDLLEMAGKLGADCPFFILKRPMLMGSRGDKILSEIHLEEREYLLIVPPFGLSTAQVYAEVKSPLTPGKDRFTIDSVKNDIFAPEQWLENDLETAAFGICPELKLIKAELLEAGALGVLMSGSGSSVFGVFKDSDHLCNGIGRLKRRDGYRYIPTTRLTGERDGDNRGKGVSGQG